LKKKKFKRVRTEKEHLFYLFKASLSLNASSRS